MSFTPIGVCKICGSHAINPHMHDRTLGEDLNLCDVCYWKKRAKTKKRENAELKKERDAARRIVCETLAVGIVNMYGIKYSKAIQEAAQARNWEYLYDSSKPSYEKVVLEFGANTANDDTDT